MSPADERARPGETSGRDDPAPTRYIRASLNKQFVQVACNTCPTTHATPVHRPPPNRAQMKKFRRGDAIATRAIPDIKLRNKLKYTERCVWCAIGHPVHVHRPPPHCWTFSSSSGCFERHKRVLHVPVNGYSQGMQGHWKQRGWKRHGALSRYMHSCCWFDHGACHHTMHTQTPCTRTHSCSPT